MRSVCLLPLIAVLLAGALSSRPALAQAGAAPSLRGTTVQVCDDANEWPPYTYRDAGSGGKDGAIKGFSVELLERLLQPLGMSYRIELLPWKRCLLEVQRGVTYQMLLNATRNPERERDYLIVGPTYTTRPYYFWNRRLHPQGLAIQKQADLKSYRLGGVLGYTYSQLNEIDMASLQRAPNYASLTQMLRLGRIDLMIVGEEFFRGMAGRPGYDIADDPDLGRAPLPVDRPNEFHMLISRQHPLGPALQTALSAGLAALERSGELQALRERFVRP